MGVDEMRIEEMASRRSGMKPMKQVAYLMEKWKN